MAEITITDDIDGLLEAAEEILHPKTSGPVVMALRARGRWQEIRRDYEQLREAGALKEDAVRELSRKHHYSVKSIETIIYERVVLQQPRTESSPSE